MGRGKEFREIVEKVFTKDPVILNLYQKFGLPNEEAGLDIFNDLVRSIVGQQLSVGAAKTIYGRFIALFAETPNPDTILLIETEALRSAGLSGQKSSYIKNVAVFFKENSLVDHDWTKYSDQEILDLLTQIKGVGAWTTQMLLMFSLNRLDVFPIDDLGIRLGMKEFYDLEMDGKELRKELVLIAEKWAPYRSIASKLIWLGRDKK